MAQLALIPVSQGELNASAYRLAVLLEKMEIARLHFEEARKAHKEHMGALQQEVTKHRATIRRAQREQEEGLMGAQVEAVLNHHEERTEQGA